MYLLECTQYAPNEFDITYTNLNIRVVGTKFLLNITQFRATYSYFDKLKTKINTM